MTVITEDFIDAPGVFNIADAYREAMFNHCQIGDPTENAECFRHALSSEDVSVVMAAMTDDDVGVISWAARYSDFAKEVPGFVFGYGMLEKDQKRTGREFHEDWAKAAVAYLILKGVL